MRIIDDVKQRLNLAANKLTEEAIYAILGIFIVSIFVIVSFSYYSFVLFVACFLALAIIIIRKPAIGIYITIFCTFVFERHYTLLPIYYDDYVIKIYPLDIVLAITVLALLLRVTIGKRPQFKAKLIELPMLIFSGIFALFFAASFFMSSKFEIAFSTFKNFILYMIFYVLIINLIKSRDQLRRMFYAMLAAGIAIVVFIALGMVTGSGIWSEYMPLSTFGDRLLAGPHAWYAVILIVGMFCYLAWKKRSQNVVILLWGFILVLLLGISFSLVRHLWIALFLALFVCLIFFTIKQRNRVFKLVAISALLIFLAVVVLGLVYSWQGKTNALQSDLTYSIEQRFTSLFDYNSPDSSVAWRFTAWQKAWDEMKNSYFLGIGLGKELIFDFEGYESIIEVRDLHNDYVSVALQLGFLGIASFLAMIISWLIFFKKNYQKITNQYKPFFIASFGLIIAFIFNATFSGYFDVNLWVITIWIFVGCLVVITSLSKKESVSAKALLGNKIIR